MDLYLLFISILLVLVLFMFFQDIFPKCSLCKRIKPRMFFPVHQRTGVFPGYRFAKSVCAKCCRKYNIDNIKKFERLRRIKNKVEMEISINKGCKLKE